ncbi:Uncharacterized protein SCF082_LOCUS8303 [Durusdinium trenchii]|uniref:Tyr recombinase domain-containing protein n=1 Tax=Durusdinium trenchii TaxID=1381693 RepID=A0ABP0ISS5_9DINO
MIALLDLQPTQVLRFSADDLSDFYYTFKVSHARCLRNAIRCKFKGWELAHLQGFPEDGDRNGEYLIALSTLAMGDSLAVEVAQQAHTHVLRDLCGAMLVHETMRYRFPCPRTDFIELLAIDDHVGIQKVTWDEYRLQTPKRDTFVFQAAERAYNKVGLVQHPKKRKRNLTDGIILGADFDGVAGRVMSPRNRVLMLSLLSLTIAARGEKVSSYSGAYPIGLTDRMASGSVAAKRGARGVIPSFVHSRTLSELQMPAISTLTLVGFEKNPARWLRFLLLLAGDIEENPGPVRPQVARGPMDLSVGFAESTAQRMHKCLLAFKLWVENEFPNSWSKLERDCSALCWAVRAYGLHCFSSGLPRYMFVYTITAIQDQYPGSKNHMSVAWQIDKKWQAYEPGQCRAVLPASAVRAAVCLACLWQWLPWAGVVLLAFSAMLHPSELVALVRKDLVFPRDLDFEMSCLFLHIQNPKTARFARRQHGRIDDEFVIWFCEKLFFDLPLDQKLFPGSIHQFRRLWNCIMKRLGIPFKQTGRGATPGVLRGSGATYLYALSEDIAWIAWRGRWARTKTLEFYLQEVAAQLLLHQLDPVARETIRVFDSASYAVLCASVAYGVECEKRKTEECLPKSL